MYFICQFSPLTVTGQYTEDSMDGGRDSMDGGRDSII
jgi:hypothetical protein